MRDLPLAPMPLDATTALARYLQSENAILRSAAIKALTGLGADPDRSASLLTKALLDPDPDVRSDAMDALSQMAEPTHAPLLLRSLTGDPVREVKRAAIAGLARMRDSTAIPQLRDLALSRCAETVAWEDEDSDWEDWLDIQIAAIEALGEMKVLDAIDVLLAARDDIYGQNLDIPVIQALANMGQVGTTWLLAILQTEKGAGRRRALEALSQLDSAALCDHLPMLFESTEPPLRKLAIRALPANAPELARLAETDPDAEVRVAALRQAAVARPDLAVTALGDPDPRVQSAALDLLPDDLEPDFIATLTDNMQAWLASGAPGLITACARHLPRFAGMQAREPLRALVRDSSRPLDARVTAARALCDMTPAVETSCLIEELTNPATQVRAAFLVALRDRAEAGDADAISAISEAISAKPLPGEDAEDPRQEKGESADVTVPKDDERTARRIRISPDGDIVTADDDLAGSDGNSTLAAILVPMDETASPMPELAEDTPEEAPAKRRKRRSVEGPHAVIEARALEAVRICGSLDHSEIQIAQRSALDGADAPQRRAIWQALAAHASEHTPSAETREAAGQALRDDDPVVRLAGFQVLLLGEVPDELRDLALRDPDALVRAAAIPLLPCREALDHLGDPTRAVRTAAVDSVLRFGDGDTVAAMATRLAAEERTDSLAQALALSEAARQWLFGALADPQLSDRAAFVLMEAAGQLSPAP